MENLEIKTDDQIMEEEIIERIVTIPDKLKLHIKDFDFTHNNCDNPFNQHEENCPECWKYDKCISYLKDFYDEKSTIQIHKYLTYIYKSDKIKPQPIELICNETQNKKINISKSKGRGRPKKS